MVLPSTSCAQSSLPAFTRFSAPNPSPPPPGETFTLPPSLTLTTNPANPNAPACAEWTRTAAPDESLLITGMNFSAFHDDHLGKDTRFRLADGSGQPLTQAHIQRLQTDKAILTIPKDIARWTMYLLWPANQTGYGQPIALNQTEAWWIGPDQAAPGNTVSVFGRNLSHHNDTLQSHVYIKPKLVSQGSGQWLPVNQVNPYRVSVELPANLTPGEYEVWTHNGHGGGYGWSGPLVLSVQIQPAWTSVRFNVKDYGARGDGRQDNTGAIRQALAAARQSPYSTVYFPAGVYIVSDQLEVSSQTRWMGQGKDQSVLRCGSGFSPQASAMVQGQVNHLELAEMAFEGDHHYKGTQPEPIFLRGSQGVRLTNVRFSFQDYNIIQLDQTNHVFVNGCELTGKISFLGKSSQLFFDRCHFRLTNDAELALHSWGGTGISLTNSTCQDLDNSDPNTGAGWGKGRFFVGTGNWGSNRFTYIAHNTTINLAPRPQGGVDQNSGEQFLWEGNQTDWIGSPSVSTDRITSLPSLTTAYEFPHDAVIIKGRGLGQSRRITGYQNGTITVETPWTVVPDPTSVLVLGNFVDRVVLYRNHIDGKAQAASSPTHVASTGIQPYGGTTNLIADANILHEVRAGIANWSTQETVGLCPNYFNLFTNNQMLKCRWGIQNVTDATRPEGTAILGTLYRRNRVGDALVAGITNVLYPSTYALLDALVYEHNMLTNVPTGYATEVHFRGAYDFSSQPGSLANQVLYANAFSRKAGSGGGSALTLTPRLALRENTFVGFTPLYQGRLSSSVLEAPVRVVELSNDEAGEVEEAELVLWNSGSGPLRWQASSSASWLTVVISEGVIADQGSSGRVALRADSRGLTLGEHQAVVSVRVNGQTTYYSVHFTVNDINNAVLNVSPNPFVQNTLIEFESPKDEEAKLEIFNIQGKLIETVFKGMVKAKQVYKYEFNGSLHNSGVYICRLICGEAMLSQRLLLIK